MLFSKGVGVVAVVDSVRAIISQTPNPAFVQSLKYPVIYNLHRKKAVFITFRIQPQNLATLLSLML